MHLTYYLTLIYNISGSAPKRARRPGIPIDPILPAKLSLDNVRDSRMRSDRQEQRVSYIGLDPPQPKKRKDHPLTACENAVDYGMTDGHYAGSSTEGRCSRQKFSAASPGSSALRGRVEPTTDDEYEWNLGFALGNEALTTAESLKRAPEQAEQHFIGSSIGLSSPHILKSTALPPVPPIGNVPWSGPQKPGTLSSSTRLEGNNAHTSALSSHPAQSIGRPIKSERSTTHQLDSALIDLTAEDGHSFTSKSLLSRHIEQHALMVFLPEIPHLARARAFGICNTLEKFFAQAHQGRLFTQRSSLGRLLGVKILGSGDLTMGIAEGDQEDFQDFVRELSSAACWKMTDLGIEGDCKVEVRLQTS